MHDQAMPATDPRAEFIAALRDLADYLAEDPALPVPYRLSVNVFPGPGTDAEDRAEVDQFAAMTGATTAEEDGHYTAIKDFGPIEYTAVAVSSARMALHWAEASYRGCVEPDLQS
jgi:hypothetical protein